jgi:hypothetical protein
VANSAEPAPPRAGGQLRRLQLFVGLVLVVGVAQAIGAGVVAALDDSPATGGLQVAVALGVAVVGATALSARRRFLARPWGARDADDLVVAYAGRIVVLVVLALGSANVAYAGAIVVGAPWLVTIGLVLLVLPLAQTMPTARNLARIEAWLAAQGEPHQLAAALRGEQADGA